MIQDCPFRCRDVRGFSSEVKDEWGRLAMINDMNRETLLAALDWPDCQPKVKKQITRRLKQFDEWGYDVLIEFNGGKPAQTVAIPGNEATVRRKALFKRNALRVVELTFRYTRESWIAAHGDGKTRM